LTEAVAKIEKDGMPMLDYQTTPSGSQATSSGSQDEQVFQTQRNEDGNNTG